MLTGKAAGRHYTGDRVTVGTWGIHTLCQNPVHFRICYGGKAVCAGGYSGFGISASRFGSRVGLAKLMQEKLPETRVAFAATEPGWIPPEPFRAIGAHITMAARDDADPKGGWRRPWLTLVNRTGFPLI